MQATASNHYPTFIQTFNLQQKDPLTGETFQKLFNSAKESMIPSYLVACVKYRAAREGESKLKFLDGVTFFIDNFDQENSHNIKKIRYFFLKCFKLKEDFQIFKDKAKLIPLPEVLSSETLLGTLVIACDSDPNTDNVRKAQVVIGLAINSLDKSQKTKKEALRWLSCARLNNLPEADLLYNNLNKIFKEKAG